MPIVRTEPPRLYRRLLFLSQAATPNRVKLSGSVLKTLRLFVNILSIKLADLFLI